MPSQQVNGNAGRQSLTGYRCPSCKTGLLKLHADGTNVCDPCGYELVTEWEWERRQKHGYVPGEPKCQMADDLPGSY